MKKILWAALCCMIIGTSAVWAQQQQGRGERQRGGRAMVQLADTSILNQMGLTTAELVKVAELNEAFKEQLKEQGGQRERGKRLSDEEREAQRTAMAAKVAEGRKQLRKILGTERYIEYLEKLVDRRPMMMGGQHGQRPGMRGDRGQRPRDFEGRAFRGGGFEGGEF